MVLITYGGELFHHGRRGQRWGVRNGPPYPLNQSKTKSYATKNAKRPKNAGKSDVPKKARNKKIDELVKSGKVKFDNLPDYEVAGLTTFTNKGQQYVSGLMNAHDFDWEEVTNYSDLGGFTSTASVIGSHPNAHKMSDDDGWNVTHVKERCTNDIDMQACNPDFGTPGTTQNCAKCSATMELRLRGYDISAGRQSYPSSVDAQSLWFKGAKRMHMDSDVAEDTLRSFGPGTSGTVSIQYPNGTGGHAMHWTHDKLGNFIIEDGQNGRVFGSLQDMMSEYKADFGAGVSAFRLDNCEPDWDMMAQDSVVRLAGNAGKVRNKFNDKLVDRW